MVQGAPDQTDRFRDAPQRNRHARRTRRINLPEFAAVHEFGFGPFDAGTPRVISHIEGLTDVTLTSRLDHVIMTHTGIRRKSPKGARQESSATIGSGKSAGRIE